MICNVCRRYGGVIMTKRSKIIIAAILIFLFGPWLVKTGVEVVQDVTLRFNPDISIYELPSEVCKIFFGCTPNEFFDKTMAYYDSKTDFRKKSKVDKKGNLILVLDEQDKEAWKSALAEVISLDDIRINPNIIVSEDCKEVTVICYKETASFDTMDAAFGLYSYLVHQLFAGVPPEDISVNFSLKDGVTEEIVFSESYPGDDSELSFSTRDYNFSSMYSDKLV